MNPSPSMQAVVAAAHMDKQRGTLENLRETDSRSPVLQTAFSTPASSPMGRGRGTPQSGASSIGSRASGARSSGRRNFVLDRLADTPEFNGGASPQLGSNGRARVDGAVVGPVLRSSRNKQPNVEPEKEKPDDQFDDES